MAGGDKATVTVGYTKFNPSDDKIILVNWRKLGYQLRYAQMFVAKLTQRTRDDWTKYHDFPDGIYNVFKARLDKVFVQFENIKWHEFANPDADAPCMMTQGFWSDSNDITAIYVLDRSQNWTTGATAFDAAADKREIHITLCESALSSNGKRANPKHQLTSVGTIDYVNPAKRSDLFPKKTYKHADRVNITVDGFSWSAAMDLVSDTDKNRKPSFAKTDATADLGENKFSISEPTVGGSAVAVTLTSPDTLPSGEKTKIKTYYEACFSDATKLRQAGNALKFVITGRSSGDPDTAQRQKVAAALQEIHDSSALKIFFHPGLDDDGNACTCPMSDLTIEHTSMRKLKITLPVRGSETDPMLPGDFVGAASATKCPINTEIAADGTSSVNGNAGSGSQLMVLKTASPGPCAATICQELGHSMGMTVMPQTGVSKAPTPPGVTTPKHVDNGGW